MLTVLLGGPSGLSGGGGCVLQVGQLRKRKYLLSFFC